MSIKLVFLKTFTRYFLYIEQHFLFQSDIFSGTCHNVGESFSIGNLTINSIGAFVGFLIKNNGYL